MEQIREILKEVAELENKIDKIRRKDELEDRKFSSVWWALDAASSALTSVERTLWQMLY